MLDALSPSDLSFAPKTSLYAFFRYLSQSTHAEYAEEDGLFRWHTQVPHPWFNGVICSRPPTGQDAQLIADCIRYYQSRKVTMFSWWLQPEPPLSGWGAALTEAKFRLNRDTPGMAVFLNALRGDQPLLSGLQIQPVEDLKTLRTWTEVFMTGYGLPLSWAPFFYDLLAGVGLEFPLRYYLAFWNGQPVGASSLFLDGVTAGIYNVAVLQEARGKGVGTLLTVSPLREAQAFDCTLAVLQSSELGFKLYQRLGFEKVCDMENFYWREE